MTIDNGPGRTWTLNSGDNFVIEDVALPPSPIKPKGKRTRYFPAREVVGVGSILDTAHQGPVKKRPVEDIVILREEKTE